MVIRWLYVALVVLIGLQRLVELQISRRNERQLRARGGQEHAPEQLRVMKLLHPAWLLAMLVEVFGLNRPFIPVLALAGFSLLLLGQLLRYAAIYTLGDRWTVNIMTLPEAPPIAHGIYRYIRHPNYLGVILEIAALPLIHTAYLTAFLFTIANGVLLHWRIRAEERALRSHSSDAPAL